MSGVQVSGTSAPKVSVILPTYNERESVPQVIRDVHAALQDIPHEIIVVDDNSPDRTWERVETAAKSDPRLRLVRRLANPGLSASVLEGFRAARSDKWIVMDADGQHDPALLLAMGRALDERELAVASRYLAGGGVGRWNPLRRLSSLGATWLAQLIVNVSLSDPMAGYFGIRRQAYDSVADRMNPRGFKVLLELAYRLARRRGKGGLVVAELPYRFRSRIAGRSKLTGAVIWQYVWQLVELRKETGWPTGLPKFLAVGAIGAVVNCALLWALVHWWGWHHLLASPVAIQVSLAHNFIWHDYWTFKDRRGQSPWLRRFGQYELTTLGGLFINWAMLAVLVEWARWPLMPANLTGIAAGTVLNFSLSKLWTWKRHSAVVTT